MSEEVWAGGHNGAFFASRLLASSLASFSSLSPLSEWLTSANHSLLSLMKEAGVELQERHLRWSSCAAAVRISGGQAEFVQCGDCMILREDVEGAIHQVTSNSVHGITERAMKLRRKHRKEGLLLEEESFFKNRLEMMKYNRTLANRPEGYSVANGDQELQSSLQKGFFSIQNIKSFLLISDGLFHPDLSLTDSYREIRSGGLEAYAEALRFYEHSNRLPHDDMTAIYVQL